jgi:hypothetical protein
MEADAARLDMLSAVGQLQNHIHVGLGQQVSTAHHGSNLPPSAFDGLFAALNAASHDRVQNVLTPLLSHKRSNNHGQQNASGMDLLFHPLDGLLTVKEG